MEFNNRKDAWKNQKSYYGIEQNPHNTQEMVNMSKSYIEQSLDDMKHSGVSRARIRSNNPLDFNFREVGGKNNQEKSERLVVQSKYEKSIVPGVSSSFIRTNPNPLKENFQGDYKLLTPSKEEVQYLRETFDEITVDDISLPQKPYHLKNMLGYDLIIIIRFGQRIDVRIFFLIFKRKFWFRIKKQKELIILSHMSVILEKQGNMLKDKPLNI